MSRTLRHVSGRLSVSSMTPSSSKHGFVALVALSLWVAAIITAISNRANLFWALPHILFGSVATIVGTVSLSRYWIRRGKHPSYGPFGRSAPLFLLALDWTAVLGRLPLRCVVLLHPGLLAANQGRLVGSVFPSRRNRGRLHSSSSSCRCIIRGGRRQKCEMRPNLMKPISVRNCA
jgi:hypothetical protein